MPYDTKTFGGGHFYKMISEVIELQNSEKFSRSAIIQISQQK